MNLEARLQNGKVLGKHSVQIEYGLLDSYNLCTFFMHVMNDMLNMWKKLNHTNLFMNEVSSFEKNQICFGWWKKLILICQNTRSIL